MKVYKSSSELKSIAKEQLLGHYGTAIGAFMLMILFSLLLSWIGALFLSPFAPYGTVISYLIPFIVAILVGILESGNAYLYLELACGQPVFASDILYGFKVYPLKALCLQFFLSLAGLVCDIPAQIMSHLFMDRFTEHSQVNAVYLLLTVIFLIIGNIILIFIQLILSQVFYLLQDFPDYSTLELLKMSRQIMRGHKGRLFYITISFLPLYFLVILSFGLGFLWLFPYQNAVMANFYMDLMANKGQPAVEL